MLDRLTRRDFAGLAAGALAIEHQGERIALVVVELRDLPPTAARAEPFAVILGGPASPLLRQGMHPLLHPVHGRLDIFLVPIGRDARQTRYEAIFN
jgi:hypothetical protein